MSELIRISKVVAVLSLPVFLTACAHSYLSKTSKITKSLRTNQPIEEVPISETCHDYLLESERSGLAMFLQGNYEQSLKHLNAALNFYKKNDFSKKTTATNVASFVALSDLLRTYKGSDFERSFVHYYAALAYLGEGKLNEANIELRAADEQQKFAEQKRLQRIIHSEQALNKTLAKLPIENDKLQSVIETTRSLRSEVRSKFLNASILYVSGILNDLQNKNNDALVDYKQAYSIEPNNPALIKDLYRLSLKEDVGYANQLRKTNQKVLGSAKSQASQNNDHPVVYVIYEQGFAPQRVDNSVFLNTVAGGITLHWPSYKEDDVTPNSVTVKTEDGKAEAESSVLTNVFDLAENDLIEQYPSIISRQLAKLVAQVASGVVAQNAGSSTVQQAAAIFNFAYIILGAMDTADIRSWTDLPRYIQVSKFTAPTASLDKVFVEINRMDYNIVKLGINVKLSPKDVALVYIFDTGDHVYTKVLYKCSRG